MFKSISNASNFDKQQVKISAPKVLWAAVFLLLFSTIAILVNFIQFKYPGNNYFPKEITSILLTLGIVYIGCLLQYNKTHTVSVIVKEIINFFLVLALIAFATNAVQFTPFLPIDTYLYSLDQWLHLDILPLMDWTQAHPVLKRSLIEIYNSLPYQMCFIPLIIILLKRFDLIREHYFLLMSSTLLGFFVYYFFPTIAPAGILTSSYFSKAQYATSLKFSQIHHYIPPTTFAGGLISFPSFHVIWAWLCVYLLKDWPIAFWLLLIINLGLVLACILLGWHYVVDIIGSLIIILAIHYGLNHTKKKIYKKYAD